jgi:glutamate racemase
MSHPLVPIGVFDSGVGGLSVLRHIAARLPAHPLIYVADTAHVPYGGRSPEFIRERSLAIARFLVEDQHAGVVVVACNTATTHAVDHLRVLFPGLPIVGMEPAIKPAAAATRSGVVGVLATEATLGGERFVSLVRRHTNGVEVLTQPSPGLVERVEAGDLAGPETLALLRSYTEPMIRRGADTLVLGCTHYVFLRPALQQILGPDITIIDTGAAVARQVERLCPPPAAGEMAVPPAGGQSPRFYTSGRPDDLRRSVSQLWGPVPAGIAYLPSENPLQDSSAE